jgi:hypothetical protein
MTQTIWSRAYKVAEKTSGRDRLYALVSPGGDPLYTFADRHSALEEAAVLNLTATVARPWERFRPGR